MQFDVTETPLSVGLQTIWGIRHPKGEVAPHEAINSQELNRMQ